MKTTYLNSGDLTRAVGVNKENLRFYERKALSFRAVQNLTPVSE